MQKTIVYSHADSDADTNTEMPIVRFPDGRFPGFCQFHMEKKEFAVEMKTLCDFPYFLIYISSFNEISNYSKTNLRWYLHVQIQQ